VTKEMHHDNAFKDGHMEAAPGGATARSAPCKSGHQAANSVATTRGPATTQPLPPMGRLQHADPGGNDDGPWCHGGDGSDNTTVLPAIRAPAPAWTPLRMVSRKQVRPGGHLRDDLAIGMEIHGCRYPLTRARIRAPFNGKIIPL
jgi:hypothetical protein